MEAPVWVSWEIIMTCPGDKRKKQKQTSVKLNNVFSLLNVVYFLIFLTENKGESRFWTENQEN